MTKKIDIDKLIEQVIKKEIDNIPLPPLSNKEAWEQLQQKIKESNRNQKKFKKPLKSFIYAAIGIVVIVGALLWAPLEGVAFSRLTCLWQNKST